MANGKFYTQRVLGPLAIVLCAANALAMPTQEELKKAQPLVVELMADDMAKFKAAGYKEKSAAAVKVGDASREFAKAAETEAAKFLLLKGAVNFYARGESYDKAADAVNALRTEIVDVPPAVVEEIIRKSTARVTAKKAPRLFSQYRVVQVQVAAAKEVSTVKVALAKKPNDAELVRKLAEAQALSGDWKSSLDTFAKQGNKAGATAKAELESRDLPDVADFWWSYESYLGENDVDIFKMHAVSIYKKCLADGSIDGLKKNIVEKRLNQVESVAATWQNANGNVFAKKSASLQEKRIVLKLPGGGGITLILCPAGKFTMGYDSKPSAFVKHEVEITRPFWMSEAPITVGQYCALMGPYEERFKPRYGVKPEDGLRKLEDVMGGADTAVSGVLMEETDRFCAKATTTFGNLIPEGYVVRLPTDAEREYGFLCGGKIKNRIYREVAEGKTNVKHLDSICGNEVEFVKACMARAGVSFVDARKYVLYFAPPRQKVKMFSPNDWGFFDMVGQNWERVLDRVPALPDGIKPYSKIGIAYLDKEYMKYAVANTSDPLMYCSGPDASPLGIMRQSWHAKCVFPAETRDWESVFRLVVGPDLVSEWKAKNGKK